MASPSSVLTLGLGSWGSASLLVTLGYGSSTQVMVPGPYRVDASQAYLPGGTVFDIYRPGPQASQARVPGSQEGDAF